MQGCVLLLFAPLAVLGQRCNGPAASVPSFPGPDSSVKNPRAPQKIVTRAANSEVVDLGHPGPRTSTDEQSDCPFDESNLQLWSLGVQGDDVELPANTKVLLSSCALNSSRLEFGKVTIPKSSELIFADEPIEVSVTGIEVRGKLRAGSESCRLRSKITITLRGQRPEETSNVPVDRKGIYVPGGTLDIHAVEYYQTWSRLAVTAEPGDEFLLVQDAVNWDAGAKIVLLTTQLKDARDWHQNEEFFVKDVKAAPHFSSGNITAVYLNEAIKYKHYGGKEYQAEVALLSRRFVIQGDAQDSEPTDTTPLACSNDVYASFPCPDTHLTGYGGHVFVTGETATARVSGVEFYRMGQTNVEGRYPMHWHLVNEGGRGSYVRDSSFHRSFYKCVTIHGTHEVLVSRNVAYDVVGHCLYLEDGVEENNVLEYNLHAHVHPIGMPPGHGSSAQDLEDIYSSANLTTASDATASGFYVSNAHNSFKGNAAVGGFSGFQFPSFPKAIKEHRGSKVTPRSRGTLLFDGNSCHSSGFWWGHGACVYVGGQFYHTDDSLDPKAPMIYNPGRSQGAHRTCEVELGAGGWCPSWTTSKCSGAYPTACFSYLEFSNLKVALTSVGLMHWGRRGRIRKFEAHDLNGGPAAEVFGDQSVTQMLVTCETGNDVVSWCDSNCRRFDQRWWRARRKVVQQYDTAMNTLVTNVTVRRCDPAKWRTDCKSGCADSSIFEAFTHSNQHLPEVMSMTADIRFDEDDDVLQHLAYFSVLDAYSASGRTVAWLDADGGVCQQRWGPTILGSNHDAGEWFKLDSDSEDDSDECVSVGRHAELWCCRARERLLASLYVKWDDSLEAQLVGNGGTMCANNERSACPRVAYLGLFGRHNDLERQGLKVTMRPEIVGPVPTLAADEGIGWYLWLDEGAPRVLELRHLQIHHSAILIMAVAYPKGTSFQISMATDDSYWGCGSKYLCHVDYDQAQTLAELWALKARPSYYVDSSADYDLLYFRVVQRDARRFSEDMTWDDEYESPVFTDSDYFKELGWGLPYRKKDPVVTVKADCPNGGGAYCAGGPLPRQVPPLLWQKNDTTPAPTTAKPTTAKPSREPTTATPTTAKPTTSKPSREPTTVEPTTAKPTAAQGSAVAPSAEPIARPTQDPTARPSSGEPTGQPTTKKRPTSPEPTTSNVTPSPTTSSLASSKKSQNDAIIPQDTLRSATTSRQLLTSVVAFVAVVFLISSCLYCCGAGPSSQASRPSSYRLEFRGRNII